MLGLAVSIASTVVLLRELSDNGLLNTPHGTVAVGWLVLEDLATVRILVLLPALVVERQPGRRRRAGVGENRRVRGDHDLCGRAGDALAADPHRLHPLARAVYSGGGGAGAGHGVRGV
ncbi:MAG: cation:proton antiporter [Anaerolineae bacterium]